MVEMEEAKPLSDLIVAPESAFRSIPAQLGRIVLASPAAEQQGYGVGRRVLLSRFAGASYSVEGEHGARPVQMCSPLDVLAFVAESPDA